MSLLKMCPISLELQLSDHLYLEQRIKFRQSTKYCYTIAMLYKELLYFCLNLSVIMSHSQSLTGYSHFLLVGVKCVKLMDSFLLPVLLIKVSSKVLVLGPSSTSLWRVTLKPYPSTLTSSNTLVVPEHSAVDIVTEFHHIQAWAAANKLCINTKKPKRLSCTSLELGPITFHCRSMMWSVKHL